MAKISDSHLEKYSQNKLNRKITKNKDVFFAKIKDAIKLASKNQRPYFIGFLDEVHRSLASNIAENLNCHYHFWGGYENALRVFFSAFPETVVPENDVFPIASIYISFNPINELSHRDFLGSLMGLGISRDTIGDILVGNGSCVIFAKNDIAEFIKLNLSKVGKSTIKFVSENDIELPSHNSFEVITKTVASNRLDAIIAALLNLSRAKAANLIREKKVNVNYRQIDSLSVIICKDDVLSIRGRGKFIIDQLGPVTRKNRIKLFARKYK